MSTNTKNILLEITSTKSIELCKKVMEELLTEMINTGIVSKEPIDFCKKVEDLSLSSENNSEEKNGDASNGVHEPEEMRKLRRTLIIQQVKIADLKGELKSVYPSRVDLNFNSSKIEVTRVYDD